MSTLGESVGTWVRPGLSTNFGVWFPERGFMLGFLSRLLLNSSRSVFKVVVMMSIVFSNFSFEWHPLVQGGGVEGVSKGREAVILAGGS